MKPSPGRLFLFAFVLALITALFGLFVRNDMVFAQSPMDLSGSNKTVSSSSAKQGDVLTYTITISNSSAISAPNTIMRDLIPGYTAYVTSSVDGGATYNSMENRIEWVGTVSATNSVVITYQVRIDDPLLHSVDQIVNTATISQSSLTEPVLVSETIQIAQIAHPADLSQSTKMVEPAIAIPGDTLRYTLLISNSSNYDAPDVLFTDPIPLSTTIYCP